MGDAMQEMDGPWGIQEHPRKPRDVEHPPEGEFFRHAVSKARERLEISVTAIRERQVYDGAKTAFGNAASRVQRRISSLRSSTGPPWIRRPQKCGTCRFN